MDSEVSPLFAYTLIYYELKTLLKVLVSLTSGAVSNDLIRYMGSTLKADGETFLTKDPNWATDFAPDGLSR